MAKMYVYRYIVIHKTADHSPSYHLFETQTSFKEPNFLQWLKIIKELNINFDIANDTLELHNVDTDEIKITFIKF